MALERRWLSLPRLTDTTTRAKLAVDKLRSGMSRTVALANERIRGLDQRSLFVRQPRRDTLLSYLRQDDVTPEEKRARFVDTMRGFVNRSAMRLELESEETQQMARLLGQAAQGETLSESEWGQVHAQLADVARVVPTAALLAAPGGSLVLLALNRLNVNVLPSSFTASIAEVNERLTAAEQNAVQLASAADVIAQGVDTLNW